MKDTSMVDTPPPFPLKQRTARMLEDAFKEYIPLPDGTAARCTRHNTGGIVSIWSPLHWEHNISLLHCLPSFLLHCSKKKGPGWKQKGAGSICKERETQRVRGRERQWDKGRPSEREGESEREGSRRHKREKGKTENKLSAGWLFGQLRLIRFLCLVALYSVDGLHWLYWLSPQALRWPPVICSQNTHFNWHSITN